MSFSDRNASDTLSPTNRSTSRAVQKSLSSSYTADLLTYSVERLRKEPELLDEEKKKIERSVLNVCTSHYTAFIDAARCLESIHQELSTVSKSLDLLLKDVPVMAVACDDFSRKSSSLVDQFAANKQLANSQSALMEVLEIPHLMETCVRNAVFDEALDLQSFVSRLSVLHPNVPTVQVLVKQTSDVGKTMLNALLVKLATNIQLPECLRVMGYLRRISAFSEPDLRLQFLRCREEWMNCLVDDLEENDSYEFLKKLTEVERLHLFDAIMMYRAVFFDSVATNTEASKQASIKESAALYSWVLHRLFLFEQALKKHLPRIHEGGNLASVLEHCLYCGSSLSRVGLDFQPILHPLFEECVLHIFSATLANAVEAFNSKLESHKWVSLPAPMAARSKVEGESKGGSEPNPDGADHQDLAPPYSIMVHVPLAVLTNGVLTALNDLRHCALLSTIGPSASLLEQCVEHSCASLLHYTQTRSLSLQDLALFHSAVKSMLEVCLPYYSSCFSRVFQGNGVARHAGAIVDFKGSKELLLSAFHDS